MSGFTCTLECGHQVSWQEDALTPGAHLPSNGILAWCAECAQDQAIEECEPRQVDVDRMAYTSGEVAVIFYDTRSGTYGYCFTGVSDLGMGFESDDIVGFESVADAKASAIAADADADAHEMEEMEEMAYA